MAILFWHATHYRLECQSSPGQDPRLRIYLLVEHVFKTVNDRIKEVGIVGRLINSF